MSETIETIETKENEKNLFKLAINKTINNYYVYGAIILILMIVIFITFNINNLSKIEEQINTVQKNNSRMTTGTSVNNSGTGWIGSMLQSIFSKKNLQLIILGSYFLLTITFLFLYNRAKKENYGYLNIFTSREDKIKTDMGIPLANLIGKIGYLFGGILIILLAISIVLWLYNSFSKLQDFFNLILTLVNFILLLTIVYVIFQKSINRLLNHSTKNLNFFESIIKIAGEFIFLIPCLTLILIDVIKNEIKITAPTIWIILFIEIIIITLYFFIPFLMKNLNSHDGNMLLEGPVFINKKRLIGTYQNVQKNDIYREKIKQYNFSLFKSRSNVNTFDVSTNTFKDSDVPFNVTVDLEVDRSNEQLFNFNYNYGVSLFIYINRQPTNTSRAYVVDTPIFDYASKPKIVYNGVEQQLKFICTDVNNLETTIYETNDIKYQKWMHIVVNYRSGYVDIFIDGTLRATKNNIQPFMEFSKIYVGSNDGIAGGIKNVMYFKEPLSIDKINYLNRFT